MISFSFILHRLREEYKNSPTTDVIVYIVQHSFKRVLDTKVNIYVFIRSKTQIEYQIIYWKQYTRSSKNCYLRLFVVID